jgi:hypothetical protein
MLSTAAFVEFWRIPSLGWALQPQVSRHLVLGWLCFTISTILFRLNGRFVGLGVGIRYIWVWISSLGWGGGRGEAFKREQYAVQTGWISGFAVLLIFARASYLLSFVLKILNLIAMSFFAVVSRLDLCSGDAGHHMGRHD